MRKLLIFLSTLGLNWASSAEPVQEKARNAFFGSWLEVEVIDAGQSIKDPMQLNAHEFSPKSWKSWVRRGELAAGTGEVGPEVDTTHEPYRVTFRAAVPEGSDPAVRPAIFKFEGGQLVIALGPWTKAKEWDKNKDYPERPSDFTSNAKNKIIVWHLKSCSFYDQD